MRNGSGQFDMAHALAAHLAHRDFDTAFFADDALVFHALILAAQAFIILDRAKDTRAEQAVTFGLERAIVDGFGLLDLAEGPAADALWRGKADLDLVESLGLGDRVGEVGQFVHFSFPHEGKILVRDGAGAPHGSDARKSLIPPLPRSRLHPLEFHPAN